jgi:hypothetical protein
MRSGILALVALAALGNGQTVTVTVETKKDRHLISPFIYGANNWDWSKGSRGMAMGRIGGNRLTAYNWENNASNAGSDWYHQNDDFMGGGNVPMGALTPTIRNAIQAGAAIVVTVPIAGYVAADKNGGGDVNQTANYLDVRFKKSMPRLTGDLGLAPNTTDAFVYQNQFVYQLEGAMVPSLAGHGTLAGAPDLGKWTTLHKASAPGGSPLFYSLDNEPDLWHYTHGRIWPVAPTYEDIKTRTIDFAKAIKEVSPRAQIFGPVNYGWNGYSTFQDATDKNKGFFLEWFLAQMKLAEIANSRRLLDVLDVHWYPEARGAGKRITESGNEPGLIEARIQAPRSLWDPTYTEDSWIAQWSTGGPIKFLPRIQSMINANYAGTKLSITEYNYGGGGDISGAMAQADVLGAFGRAGLFAAAMWSLAADERFIFGGFRAFRNFDGGGSHFGDTSVRATAGDNAKISCYASVSSKDNNRLTLVLINKQSVTTPVAIGITHPAPLRGAVLYQIQGINPDPVAGGKFRLSNNNLNLSLPARSVTTVLISG